MHKLLLPSVAVGALILGFVLGNLGSNTADNGSEKKPLYWVAPMDANYRRDEPGLSPMGMDLVPVYKEADQQDPGKIFISPDVVNNIGVTTAPAEMRFLFENISAPGMVQFNEHSVTHIHPRVAGWIEKLHIKSSGEPVKRGQALYNLYSPELVNAQQEFLAELNRAGKNGQNLIQAAEERLRALQVSQGFINSLKKNKTIKQTVTFYAPQSGIVEHLNIREGYYVEPQKTIMSIAALDTVWVEAHINERHIQFIKDKQTATMKVAAYPGKTWQGNVHYIYPALDAESQTLRIRFLFNNPNQLLKPGMISQLTLDNQHSNKKLAVKKEAVIRTGSENRVVLALSDGAFKSVKVKTGIITDDYIEIIRGLDAGEKVVTSGQFLLDSESSKTSDFKRLSHPVDLPSATVTGAINKIDLEKRSLNISRGPIEKWDRPATTMDFTAIKAIDLTDLQTKQNIQFDFVINNGEFIIEKIESLKEALNNGEAK